MPLIRSPQGNPATYDASLAGDVLTINGTAYDLSQLAEGDTLPAGAIDCPAFLGATRTAEGLSVTVLETVGLLPPEAPPEGIDWSRAETAASRKAAEREGMAVPRAVFATRVMMADIVTPEEAEAWADGSALPAVMLALLDGVPAGKARTAARIEAKAAATIHRTHPMVAALGDALGLTEEQRDSLFAPETETPA